ncbi:MAG: PP2C family serine/threonine-protein phosphatase [Pseudomonadales bacterium]
MALAQSLYLNADTEAVVSPDLHGHRIACYTRPMEPGRINQDSAAVLALDAERVLLIVADGMGGGPSGDRASALAVRAIAEQVMAAERAGAALRVGILDGFEQAQRQVSAELSGAASTLIVAEIQGNQARTYHVGDSAICVFGQRGKLKLQTGAHSPVGYALRSGLLDEDEALHHEDRHYVSNMIGMDNMSVEVGLPFTLAPKDTLVIASDGLFDNLQLEEVIELARSGPLDRAAATLVEQTAQRMAGASTNTNAPSKPDDLTLLMHRLR